jgi:peptide/nickel transport system substrate-binding protein
MAKKLIVTIVALIGILAMVLPGCTGGEPTGEPISVNVLIRTEDEREQMGDYLADQLEDLGFTVTRQKGISGDLAGIWLGDPDLGLWNVYTGGWVSTAVSRDEGSNFGAFFTPLWSAMGPLWQAYEPTEEFMEVSEALWYNDFTTYEERDALFADAIPMSMNDSVRIFLTDNAGFSPLGCDVAMAADAYGGIYGSWLWGPTIHFRDTTTGNVLVPDGNFTMDGATVDLLIDPWNPVAGSNWAYDRFPQTATGEMGCEYDTQTGLAWPHRITDASVTAQTGLPIGVSSPHEAWVSVDFEDEIQVPDSAWVDWDATTQQFITKADKYPSTNITALTKTVVNYPAGTVKTDDSPTGVVLHDGSMLDEADFLLYAILTFDRGKTDSAIYDAGYATEFNAFMSHFKGVEYTFGTDGSLTVTTWDDYWYLDAELIARGNTWFPAGSYGQFTWPNLALAIHGESLDPLELAFSKDKATKEKVDWTSFIGGVDLLAKLDGYLETLKGSGDIPYGPTLDTYISVSEAQARYTALETFYDTYGHFWVGSGTYYLHDVDFTANTIELRRFADHGDDADLWFHDGLVTAPEGCVAIGTVPDTHTGAWVDVITLRVVTDNAAAVNQLIGDELDFYAFSIVDADLLEDVEAASNVGYYLSAGSFNEFTFNPCGPFFGGTGKINPFSMPEVRQALQWAIDRDYIVGTIMGGLAFPRYTAVGVKTGDYINYQTIIEGQESFYAYNFNKADAAIEAAMLTIPGVTRDEVTDKYMYLAP